MSIADARVQQLLAPHLQRVLIVDPQPAAVKMLGDLLRSITPAHPSASARSIQP